MTSLYQRMLTIMVRVTGVEPAWIAPQDPNASVTLVKQINYINGYLNFNSPVSSSIENVKLQYVEFEQA